MFDLLVSGGGVGKASLLEMASGCGYSMSGLGAEFSRLKNGLPILAGNSPLLTPIRLTKSGKSRGCNSCVLLNPGLILSGSKRLNAPSDYSRRPAFDRWIVHAIFLLAFLSPLPVQSGQGPYARRLHGFEFSSLRWRRCLRRVFLILSFVLGVCL